MTVIVPKTDLIKYLSPNNPEVEEERKHAKERELSGEHTSRTDEKSAIALFLKGLSHRLERGTAVIHLLNRDQHVNFCLKP